MKKLHIYLARIVPMILLVVLFIAASPNRPGLAVPSLQVESGGLLVTNAILNLEAVPGQTYVHEMDVILGSQAVTGLDITVEARGFSESLSGDFIAVPAVEDTYPFSAREFITEIDNPTFRLEVGESATVRATFQLPETLDDHARYAIIYFSSQPIETGNNVASILAINVPVIIVPQGLQIDLSGEISEFKVNPVVAGQPLEFITTVQNKGNHHYKVYGNVKISDSNGQPVTDLNIPLTRTSILPAYAQNLIASYRALDKTNGLEPGSYSAVVDVFYEDGALLDSAQLQFEVTAPFTPCPGIDPANIFIVNFNDEEPGLVDARDQTDIQVTFSETGKVTGSLVICKYTQPPEAEPAFSADLGNGGAGQTALNYVIVAVDGFNLGEAQVGYQYRQSNLGGLLPDSLFLAFKDGLAWRKLENLAVQTGAELVVGSLPVQILTRAPLIALGGGAEAQSAAVEQPALLGLPVVVGIVVIVFLFLLIILILLLTRRRQAERK